jgi:hypothetical protein
MDSSRFASNTAALDLRAAQDGRTPAGRFGGRIRVAMLFSMLLALSFVLEVLPFNPIICHRSYMPQSDVKKHSEYPYLRQVITMYTKLHSNKYPASRTRLTMSLSRNFEPGDHSLERFHELSKRLLEKNGGQLDSLSFGRKWRLVYPDIDLDAFR